MNAPDRAIAPTSTKDRAPDGTSEATATPIGRQRGGLVWDLPVRLFHWTMVGSVVIAAISGFYGLPRWLTWHVYSGYAIGLLLLFRGVWGLAGSPTSRFRSFPLSPAALRKHLRDVFRGHSDVHVGHNPAGAWMIVCLLLVLTGLIVTGLVALGGQKDQGPLAALVDFQVGFFARHIHSFLAGCLVAAVAVHLTGVLVETAWFRHSVLRAMITGRKLGVGSAIRGLYAVRGLAVFAVVAGVAVFLGDKAASLPPSGWHALSGPGLKIYDSACTDCHWAFHPSLRTAAEWRTIIGGLDNHFGEDASVDPVTAKKVLAFLVANSASTFDTEASNLVGRGTPAGMRLTDTRFWKWRHHRLPAALFKTPAIGSRANCVACHKDARTGRFEAQAIAIPKKAFAELRGKTG